MKLAEARKVTEALVVEVTATGRDVRAELVQFLTRVARGPWWTTLKPNPEQPTWGAKTVYVVYRPRTPSAPGIYAVQQTPSRDTMPLKVGAGRREVERVADALLAKVHEGVPVKLAHARRIVEAKLPHGSADGPPTGKNAAKVRAAQRRRAKREKVVSEETRLGGVSLMVDFDTDPRTLGRRFRDIADKWRTEMRRDGLLRSPSDGIPGNYEIEQMYLAMLDELEASGKRLGKIGVQAQRKIDAAISKRNPQRSFNPWA